MAARDKELEKRTRELAGKKGGDLADYQAIGNQVQAIQDQRIQNLALEKAAMDQDEEASSMMLQAGQIASMSGNSSQMQVNPQTQQILGKYGIQKPRVQRTQGREVKVTPNNIVINNNYNTTTTNVGGPVQGRDVTITPPPPRNVENPEQTKFKTWVSNAFATQKEQNLQRRREFDRREWSLTKSANKMLRKMETVGKDMMSAFSPKAIGESVGGQFKNLLMLFGVTFLAKHWTRVLKAITWVSEKIKGGLDYFGIGVDGNTLARAGKGFRADFIGFFGGDVRKGDTVGTALMRVGKDLIDYLKMKLDHGMEERGAAIRSIKFPDVDLSNIGLTLSNMAGYLGNILTAMVDPKRGIQASLKANIKTSGIQSSKEARLRDGFDEYNKYKKLRNTDIGDFAAEENGAGKRRYSLLKNAIDSTGSLTGSLSSQISQGQDILGAYNDARQFGKIDAARVATGFGRLEDTAKLKGSVTVSEEFIERMFQGDVNKLIQNGSIRPVAMKYVVADKTEKDFAGQNARGLVGGYLKGAMNEAISGVLPSGSGRYATNTLLNLADGGLGFGTFGAATTAIGNKWNRMTARDKKLVLVPIDDPRPGVEFRNYYQMTPAAISYLTKKLYGASSYKNDAMRLFQGAKRALVTRGGGFESTHKKWLRTGRPVRERFDFDDTEYREVFREFDNVTRVNDAEEAAFWSNSSLGAIENNTKRLGNSVVGAVNDSFKLANKAFNAFGDFTASFNANNVSGATWAGQPGIVNRDQRLKFNVPRAVNGLIQRAPRRESLGKCGIYVRYAIEQGLGLKKDQLCGMAPAAKDWLYKLGYLGFEALRFTGWEPQPGDIFVIPAAPGHPNGHISMYTGAQWISDYVQRDLWGAAIYRKIRKGTLFRHYNRINDSGEPFAGGGISDSGSGSFFLSGGSSSSGFGGGNSYFGGGGYGGSSYDSHIGVGGGVSFGAGGYSGGFSAGFYGGYSPRPVNISNSQQKANGASLMKFFKSDSLGLTTEQAAGLAGVLYAESGWNPGSFNRVEAAGRGARGTGGGNYGAGLAQWTFERKHKMLNWYNQTHGTRFSKVEEIPLAGQAEMIAHELKNERPEIYRLLQQARTVEQAVDIVLRGFENGSGNSLASIQQMNKYRGGYAGLMQQRLSGANIALGTIDPTGYYGSFRFSAADYAPNISAGGSANFGGGGFDISDILKNASSSGPFPELKKPFDAKSDAELEKEKRINALKGEAAALWKKNQAYFQFRGVKRYADFEKYWLGLSDKGREDSKKRVAGWFEANKWTEKTKNRINNYTQGDVDRALLGFEGEGFAGGIGNLNGQMSEKSRRQFLELSSQGRFEEAERALIDEYRRLGYKGTDQQVREHFDEAKRKNYHADLIGPIQKKIEDIRLKIKSSNDPEEIKKLKQQLNIEIARRDAIGKGDIGLGIKDKNNTLLAARLEERNRRMAQYDSSLAAIEAEKEEIRKEYMMLIDEAVEDGNPKLAEKLSREAVRKLEALEAVQKKTEEDRVKYLKKSNKNLNDAKTVFDQNKNIFAQLSDGISSAFESFLNKALTWIQSLKNWASKAWNSIKNTFSDIFNFFGTYGAPAKVTPEQRQANAYVSESTSTKVGDLSKSTLDQQKKKLMESNKFKSGTHKLAFDGQTNSWILVPTKKAEDIKAKFKNLVLRAGNGTPTSHDTGGFTRDGSTGNIVGYVHEGEWIAPKKMVQGNKELFKVLDKERISMLAGYAGKSKVDKNTIGSRTANQYDKISAAANQVSSAYMSELVDQQAQTNQLLSQIAGNTRPKVQPDKVRKWTS